jgi:hypothetical protein
MNMGILVPSLLGTKTWNVQFYVKTKHKQMKQQ